MDSTPRDQSKESFDSGCKQAVGNEFFMFQTNTSENTLELNLTVGERISSIKFNFNPFKYFEKLGEINFSQVCYS